MRRTLTTALGSALAASVLTANAPASVILVAGLDNQNHRQISVYNPVNGAPLGAKPVVDPPSSHGDLHDIAQDASGRIHIFQGEGTPTLTSLTNNAWSYHTSTPWSIQQIAVYGALTASGDYVFAQSQSDDASLNGIVRFNAASNYASTFTQLYDDDHNVVQPLDVNIGLDGFLYVNAFVGSFLNNRIYKLNPSTMSVISSVDLQDQNGERTVADAAGNLYASGLDFLAKYAPDGSLIKSVAFSGLGDLDISPEGQLLALDGTTAHLFDLNLNQIRTFEIAPSGNPFATFVATNPLPEPATAGVAALAATALLSRRRRSTK